MRRFFAGVVGTLVVACGGEPRALGGEALAARLEACVAPAHARVGIAAEVLETHEAVARDPDGHYPMQSVYKLPIAMAVLHAVDTGTLELAQSVRVEPDEFISPRQHSPLRDRHPDGVSLPLEELLRLAVAESDGTASDVLLRVLGGAERVMDYLGALGISGIRVLDTEQAIGRDDAVQYLNFATPAAAVALLRALHDGEALQRPGRDRVLRWMTETRSGRNRLKAGLPEGCAIAHKTGTSGTNDAGVTAAANDIGLVELPDGRTLAIAVFICDSTADEATRDRVFADIARAVFDAAAATSR